MQDAPLLSDPQTLVLTVMPHQRPAQRYIASIVNEEKSLQVYVVD